MSAILRLTDGTTTINLLSNSPDGFYLQEYAPLVSQYKSGGVIQDSPLADNKRPVFTRQDTVVQPVVLKARATSHDSMARIIQDLLRLLEKAKDYWASDWQNEPVWLEARTSKETNTRYTIISLGRVEELPAPYQQPFLQPNCTAVAEEMTVFLEHGQWLDVPPNTNSALAITGARYYPVVNTLTFRGISDPLTYAGITVTDNAAIQNLPSGAFTFERWAKFTVPTSGEVTFRYEKNFGNFNISDNLLPSSNNGLEIFMRFSGDNARARATDTASLLAFDGDWHHVAFTHDNVSAPRIWIDGVEVSAYNISTASTGVYNGDIGSDFVYYPILGGTQISLEEIELGWSRLSDTDRYSTTFTPPDRCTPPIVDVNTLFQLNLLEGVGTTLDNAEGTAALDGTVGPPAPIAEWTTANNCPVETGAITATTQEVFVANKFVTNRITNMHLGTGNPNLIGGSWPAQISDTVSAINIGSVDGPFNNIVLDNETAVSITSPVWEYWNGAWTTLPLSNALMPGVDFDIAGTLILSWKPPSDWVTNSPGGLPTGYWIRSVLGTTSINHAGPNDPYTVTWPFVQIGSSVVGGDIPALAQMLLRTVSSDGTSNASGATDQIIYGSRSVSRGESFRPFMNFSDGSDNISGIEALGFFGATFADNIDAGSGRSLDYTVTTTFQFFASIELNGSISREYSGRFRAFLRFGYDIGTATEITWTMRTQYGTGGTYVDSRPIIIDDTFEGSTPLSNPYLMEIGQIHIRPDLLVGSDTDIAEIQFLLAAKTDTGTASVELHEIILMPVDEFSGQVSRTPQSTSQAGALEVVDIDGTNLKLANRAVKRDYADNRIKEIWLSGSVLPPSIQANVTQRVFFLQRSSASAATAQQSVSWASFGVQLKKVSRYLGFRGSR